MKQVKENEKQNNTGQGVIRQWGPRIALIVLVLAVAAVLYYSLNSGGELQGGMGYPNPGEALIETVSLVEAPITEIALSGPASTAEAEISGLAWFGDNLIMLPQYPNIFDESGDGQLFYLPKSEIETYLGGARGVPLEPQPIQLVAPDLADQIRNFQGFEAIGFSGNRAFLTIEASEGKKMMGYLISGVISDDLSTLTLDTANLAEIDPQARSANHSDESILVMKDKVITFYEVNGEEIVSDPVAHVFDFDLKSLGTIPMPNIEYRLTDTAMGSGTNIWGINYFFPGDEDLFPKSDPILEKFGTGATHAKYPQVERLIRMQYTDSEIKLVTNKKPIYLELTEDIRNWEGLVMMDIYGFLMVTDKFPRTILAYVAIPR